jgi:hypothetical protein
MPKGDIRFTPKNKEIRRMINILRMKNDMRCPAHYIENILIEDIKKNKNIFEGEVKKEVDKLKKIDPIIENPLHHKLSKF